MTLELESWKDDKKEMMPFKFDSQRCVELKLDFCVTFTITISGGTTLNCAASKDEFFRTFFPGDYSILGLGYLRVGNLTGAEDAKAGVGPGPTKA